MERSFWTVSILGIVEGLTEFVPVSSTGHLILASHWLKFEGPAAETFNIFIQVGAILAVLFYYPDRFISFFKQVVPGLRNKEQPSLSLFHVLVAILPAIILGFLFYHTIKDHLFSVQTVAYGLIGGGICMILLPLFRVSKKEEPSLDTISLKQAIGIGIAQCFSLWPGVSRSASTILGGIFCGLGYRASAEFSFILAVPVLALAAGYDLLKSYKIIEVEDIPYFLAGGLVSFIVSCLAISFFLKLLNQFKLAPFGWYRIVLGLVVLFFTRG